MWVLRQRMNADHYCAFMHRFQDSVIRLKHWIWMVSFYFLFRKLHRNTIKKKAKGTEFEKKICEKIDLWHLYMFCTDVYSVIRLKHWLWMVSFYFLFRKLPQKCYKIKTKGTQFEMKKKWENRTIFYTALKSVVNSYLLFWNLHKGVIKLRLLL